jgi:PhnB protein
VTPYLIVKGAADAIDFYKKIYGATEIMRMPGPDGKIGHAELKIGDSVIMLADENLEMGHKSPRSVGGSPVSLVLYVQDVDRTVKNAVEAGSKLVRPVADQFYGDRTGGLVDPFGHEWYLATHIEDVSPEEMKKRADAMMAAAAK